MLNGKPIFTHARQTLPNIKESVGQITSLSSDEFYFTTQNGRLALDDGSLCNGDFHMHLRMVGGKGGFGSMLRAIGAQIEKTTNREACRDLSGRRLRDINEEKRMKAWLDKQKEREEEAANKVTKKIQKLQAKPKHEFKDKKYDEARSEMTQSVHDALEVGLKNTATGSNSSASSTKSEEEAETGEAEATASGTKRKADETDKPTDKKKKKKNKKKIKGAQWLDDGLSSSGSDSDSGQSSSGKSK